MVGGSNFPHILFSELKANDDLIICKAINEAFVSGFGLWACADVAKPNDRTERT